MPAYSLVVDEAVPVGKHRYHMRIWCTKGRTPYVVTTQIKGDCPPEFHSCWLARRAVEMLHFATPTPLFFEVSKWDDNPQVELVSYELGGHLLRPLFLRAVHSKLSVTSFTNEMISVAGSDFASIFKGQP